MSEEQVSTYDAIPYQSDPFPQTQPSVLATIGRLFGLEPAPVDKCRVLEIGCAAGGNIIPMAVESPESTFVGIDLSSRQVGEGKETVSVLGLQNIQIECRNVMDLTPEFGQFDYIIAHGVFSWVPRPVADQILAVCAKNLSPNGVAYVSYNTLPGWHMRGMIRDMMCYHTRQFARPEIIVRQARALLNFLAESVPGEKNPFGLYLRNELEFLQRMRDSYIYHDHLEKENNPVYFHEFIERAETQGLQYLGEAAFGAMAQAVHDLPAKVMATLEQITPNLVQREQYMDFVRNRTFRQTLLCHKEVALDRSLSYERLAGLYVGSPAKPVMAEAGAPTTDPQEFRLPNGAGLPVRQPITKAAMLHLSEIWPKAISFEDLQAAAQARLTPGVQPDDVATNRDARTLGASLLSMYALGFVELSARDLPTSPVAGDRPLASPLVRLQAQRGHVVTNRRQRSVPVDEFERRVLEYLDGNHDRAQLMEILSGLIANGSLVVKKPTEGTPTPEEVAKILTATLDAALARFQQVQLLVG